ncbi:SymE family type I addiction module toxin [Sodalis sp. RH14]|uniref:SymE family type I addiction module toxin n=1 Tax=Sodalis sp. RH14 TaxID=3394329 RepID=UPI0039B4A4C9
MPVLSPARPFRRLPHRSLPLRRWRRLARLLPRPGWHAPPRYSASPHRSDCKSELGTIEVKPSQPRYYTAGYAPNGGSRQTSPQLKISGRWLDELGFNTGQTVVVTSEQRCLITKTELNVLAP